MKHLKEYKFKFVVGSQFLYGPQVLETVEARAKEMCAWMNASGLLPCEIEYECTVKTPEDARKAMLGANFDDGCAGVVTWCHTFSPSKMWLEGLRLLQKPWLHFATQFNESIPDEGIDMDFMNLNQAAHGDREHGFIGARLGAARKIVFGHWKDGAAVRRIGEWMRAAASAAFSRSLKVMRFGDNMRNVAVTEGDKIAAQEKLGWQVNTWPVGALAERIAAVTDAQADALVAQYREKYDFATDDAASVRYQAKEEIAIKGMLDEEGCAAFANTFEDLYGMEQLPGLATQRLMEAGYGYGAEGDWKTAALTAVVKAMAEGKSGGTSFMEDYTYELAKGKEAILGAHMLEVCPTIAAGKPRVEVHPLGIGGKAAPARLVFEGREGPAIALSLVDMGGRMRLVCEDVTAIKPHCRMPNLPVARTMWKPDCGLANGVECWIRAGGAHHTVFTFDVTAEQMADWARIMGIEFVRITKDTTPDSLEKELFLADLAWRLKA